MEKDERGTILIEFVGSFLLFFLLILSVLSLVNIGTAQARMHYAITQTANTLSMYSYPIHVIGFDEFLIGIDENSDEVEETVNGTVDDINNVLNEINNLNLGDTINNAEIAYDNTANKVQNIMEDPGAAIQKILSYALQQGGSAIFEELLQPLIAYHLTNGDMSGEEYLRSVGIDGMDALEFHTAPTFGWKSPEEGQLVGNVTGLVEDDSIWLDKDGNIVITVQYEMAYSFMGLNKLLPFEPKLKITQSVKTKVWLGGEGEGYVNPS